MTYVHEEGVMILEQTVIVLNKEYIDSEMKRRNITSINDLARKIGISESMLHLMMKGERNAGSKAITATLSFFNEEFEKIFKRVLTKVHDTA
jgi:DNA-binding Xre family transcriptional regulator